MDDEEGEDEGNEGLGKRENEGGDADGEAEKRQEQ
jgi:hypothetical protein